jgi:L-ascorbate metabolism protein UlaG (beta-lactamase superfamily)
MTMEIRWFGQSAFLLSSGGTTVAIDPFGDMSGAGGGTLQFDYPPVEIDGADLLLITHEHRDHNAAEQVGGEPHTVRSTAGRFETPIGEVVAIASEHDMRAGTERGPNTIFVFRLGGFAVCHFGDFGQAALRPEQREAIGEVDILFLPVGGGPTVGGAPAASIVEELSPALVVPMHYRTSAINFLDPADDFLAALPSRRIDHLDESALSIESLDGARVALPAVPSA